MSVSRSAAIVWLVTVPLLAAAAMAWLGQPREPIIGEVVESSVDPTGAGYVGDVRWDDDGVARVREFDLTEEHVTSGTVPVVVAEGEERVASPSDLEGTSPVVVAGAAAVGLLFAVVVLATVRGFGFVRGTGQYGEMTPDEVDESRGFYWRH